MNIGRFFYVGVLGILLMFSTIHAMETQKVNLDGEWNFSTIDSEGGVIQSGKIRVPGAWDAQGYGKPTDKVHNNFVGIGKYEREIEVPDEWEDLDINLVIEGVSRYAKIWVNNKYIGEVLGLTGSHRVIVKKHLNIGGKNKIRIDVDSRQRHQFDAMLGAAQLNDYMDLAWGGLYGHVYLEGLPKIRLDDVYIRTKLPIPAQNIPARIIAETKIVNAKNSKAGIFNLTGAKNDKACKLMLEVFDADGKKVSSKKQNLVGRSYETQVVVADIENAKYWSPDNPYLYSLKLSLLDEEGNELHSFKWRKGIKSIQIKEGWGAGFVNRTKIMLNNAPVYLLGYGDDHIYLKEFSMPFDKQMYIDRLKKIKALGFNHVRHHSTIMPPEYYEACDEVGIMPNAEFTIGYPWQMPGTKHWRNIAPAGNSYNRSMSFYRDRYRQAVKEYRNYTCILAWVGGNELYMGEDVPARKNPLLTYFMKTTRSLDPDRLFVDTDGEWEGYILDAKNDRPELDLYFVLFDEWADFVDFERKYDTKKSVRCKHITNKFVGKSVDVDVPLKPVISHETANFCTFTRPSVVKFFEGSNFKSFWLTKSVETLAKQNMLDKSEQWGLASEKLMLRIHKHNIETIRKNPYITGYHWWLIQDYWTSSDGIFDFAFRQKEGYKTEEIRKFNSPVVALQNGLKFGYDTGEKISANFKISNFSTVAFTPNTEVVLKCGDKILKKFNLPQIHSGYGKITNFGSVEGLEKFVENSNVPQMYTLCFSAKSKEMSVANDWNFYVFPKAENLKASNVVVGKNVAEYVPSKWTEKASADCKNLKSGDVMFAKEITEDVVNALEKGATVVLFSPKKFLPRYDMKYKSQWWRAGGNDYTNYVGHFVEKSSPLSVVAPEHFCGEAFAPMFANSHRFDVEKLSSKPENTIRALSSLMYLKEYSSVMRVKVGKGMLIVSGLSHNAVRNSDMNAWVLKTLIESPKPEQQWQVNMLKQFIK
ncbi:MAG: hypothetical protein E7035_02855 [Verrucomicrobiaceae bacterium]|nr:hypothetical protein [Verrucomicrobiaceae bacterium]